MSSYFHSCVLIAAAGFLIGCGERPTKFVAAVEKGGTNPAAVQTDAKITVDSTALDATSAQSDHQRIQGSWHFVTFTTKHKDHIVFSGDKVSWHVGEKPTEGTFAIDATRQPKRIDFLKFPGEKDDAGVLLGIYDFRRELLVICIRESGGLRPTKLEATRDQTLLLFYSSSQGVKPEMKK